MNVHAAADAAKPVGLPARPLVRIVIVGHVDHGKSTLIGRLLAETSSLPSGKLEELKAVSARRGMTFEWSFLLDALQTERDHGITIDTSQIRLRTKAREFVLIDAPGHTEFLRNMITGAAQADAAVVVVEAAEGVRDQTLRHACLVHLLGIRQVVVVINKMDRVDFAQSRFRALEAEVCGHLAGFGLTPAAVIPISARHGDGVTARSDNMEWYRGDTVISALDGFAPAPPATALPLRLPVQAVLKFDDRRIIAGRLQSGTLSAGDEIVVSPTGRRARVRRIEAWPVRDEGPRTAGAGESVGITLDRELFIARGDMVAPAAYPAPFGRHLKARIFWLHETPLAVGATVTVRLGAAETAGTLTAIEGIFDPGDPSGLQLRRLRDIGQNHIADVEIALADPLAADPYGANPRTGRIAIDLGGRICGGGLVLAIGGAAAATHAAHVAHTAPEAFLPLAERAGQLARVLSGLDLAGRLAAIRERVAGTIVFTTSFGLEDQVIAHHICEAGLDIDLVTLDTGRLFPETYATWEQTEARYGRRIRAVYPDHGALERLIAAQGINGFYASREGRLACCGVRKVDALARALQGAGGWVTGLRADQSAARSGIGLVSPDREHGLLKFNPLLDWSRQAAQDFAAARGVPVNPLHGQGFPSIGCAPCTRAVGPGEEERAGRWWWEEESKKECGLHVPRGGPA